MHFEVLVTVLNFYLSSVGELVDLCGGETGNHESHGHQAQTGKDFIPHIASKIDGQVGGKRPEDNRVVFKRKNTLYFGWWLTKCPRTNDLCSPTGRKRLFPGETFQKKGGKKHFCCFLETTDKNAVPFMVYFINTVLVLKTKHVLLIQFSF